MIFSITGQLNDLTEQRQRLDDSIDQLAQMKDDVGPLAEKFSELKAKYPEWSLQLLWEILEQFADGESNKMIQQIEATVGEFCSEVKSRQKAKRKARKVKCPYQVGDELIDGDSGKSFVITKIKRSRGGGWQLFDTEGFGYKSSGVRLAESESVSDIESEESESVSDIKSEEPESVSDTEKSQENNVSLASDDQGEVEALTFTEPAPAETVENSTPEPAPAETAENSTPEPAPAETAENAPSSADPKGPILSFGECDPQTILSGEKIVTRRNWSDDYAKRFIKAWTNGETVQAWDKGPYAKGKKIADLQLKTIYREELSQMPASDLKHEAVNCESIEEFVEQFFEGNSFQTVWVLRFCLAGTELDKICNILNFDTRWKPNFWEFQVSPDGSYLQIFSDVTKGIVGKIAFDFEKKTYSLDSEAQDNNHLMRSGLHSLDHTLLEELNYSLSSKVFRPEPLPVVKEKPDGIIPGEGIKLGFKWLHHERLLDGSYPNSQFSKNEWKEFCVLVEVEVEPHDKIRDLKNKLAKAYRNALANEETVASDSSQLAA